MVPFEGSTHPAGIDFKPDTVVSKADLKGKKLTTQSGEEISFEKLIIALGSLVGTLSFFLPLKLFSRLLVKLDEIGRAHV